MHEPDAIRSVVEKPLGLCTVQASTLIGLEPAPIMVEVCCSRGPAFFQMVGLAQTTVREARVRVTSALSQLGIVLDEYAITINLSPASIRKSDAALDLAIAVGVLGATGHLEPDAFKDNVLLGELSLDGRLQPVRGVLPQLCGARDRGLLRAIVPRQNAREAGLVRGLDTRLADRLLDVTTALRGGLQLNRAPETEFVPSADDHSVDMREVHGQAEARRALEVAAAGGHNLLMLGPPGAGKTMLARRLPTILPPLSYEEALETTAIHSVAGLVDPRLGVVLERPFRAPHHSVTEQGLVGGGDTPRPGELSLAHNGVLFLDELPEFRRRVLESLRQPLEDGRVRIARARAQAEFPAQPVVVGAMNPCPCGYFTHPTRRCRCGEAQRNRYRSRLSGPLLDRLDVHVRLPPVAISALTQHTWGECSAVIRRRVEAARELQLERQRAGLTRAHCNARLSPKDFDKVVRPTSGAISSLRLAAERLGMSARGVAKVLRVARTIADLQGDTRVDKAHISEALYARQLDRET